VKVLSIIVACLLGGVVLFKLVYPTYSYRYRLNIAFEVDGKVHSGSSVIEVTWTGGPEFGDVGPYHPTVRGQAVFIDLESRGAIVATLINGESYGTSSDGAVNALWLAAKAFGNRSTNNELPLLPRLRGRRTLTPDNMPRLIWFSDIRDPRTAHKLLVKGIDKTLGPTARLADTSVEITRDPITIDVDKKLPWYEVLKRPLAAGLIPVEYGFTLSKTMFVGDGS